MEICEPLTFKGREGSGVAGGRDAYADSSFGAAGLDTAKFGLTYLLWGHYLYNPDSDPEVHHRYLRQAFGPAGPALGNALSAASRILPLVTTAWCPSASNHEFWPEMLTPVSILPITGKPLYGDSPAPHNVSAISPLDPQLFTTIDQHAQNLNSGKAEARYNTSEVITWLEILAVRSSNALTEARAAAGVHAKSLEFRRAEEDLIILIGLAFFYANLFRAGLYYSIFGKTQDPVAANYSLSFYRAARVQWDTFSKRAQSAYASDISYGSTAWRRGHWADRLIAIDADLAALDKRLSPAISLAGSASSNALATQRARDPRPRPTLAAHHTPPEAFHPGGELTFSISIPPEVTEAILWYRHVNHGERWLSVPMKKTGSSGTASIPADYTASPYPLQYYFELHTASAATLHPLLNPTLSNQPYFAVHRRV
jgi:hypothetical protein